MGRHKLETGSQLGGRPVNKFWKQELVANDPQSRSGPVSQPALGPTFLAGLCVCPQKGDFQKTDISGAPELCRVKATSICGPTYVILVPTLGTR